MTGEASVAAQPPVEKDTCAVCQALCGQIAWAGDPFPIQNTKTGKWHSGGDWGVTDCGKDTSRDHWLWVA